MRREREDDRARRELQAKKKHEHKKQKKDEDTDSRCTGDVCGKQEIDSGSDDESEASDVSNCSESDEANEKAILALEVQIESLEGEVESSPRTNRSGDSDGDASKDVEENCSLQKDKDEDLEASECHSSRSTIPDQVPENSTSVIENFETPSEGTSSLYHRPVGATGEHMMRLQQKLYESWQSIMQDYATVFGPRIVAPEGMVPIAAAKPWAPHYRINSIARKEVAEIVTQALLRLGGGWEDHPSGLGLKTTWNLLWTWSKPRVERQTLLVWQKVNHFQHAKALTRKDCLKKHIGKYLSAGGKLRQAFDIIPPTFLLPKEYVSFVQAFQERSERLRRNGVSEAKNIWIMKPVALSRGRGISLVNDLSQVIYGEQVIIQEYIAAPRLLDGFKFDLRLYVLVTSFNPLEAFLYDEGFVRLCTRPYEDSDISNIFVHLTNSSIQKENQEAITGTCTMNEEKSEASQKDTGGTKTTLAYLWRRLAAEGVDVEQVKRSIEEVVLKALLCGEDHIPFQVNSFDLLGYDILLDADLRPWLIEINSSPSMARDIDLDYQVKDAMMLDTLRVVDPLHFDRAKLAEVIARRQRDQEEEKRRPHAHTRHPRETEELAARQLNEDLTAILRGKVPRAYGEMPEDIGNYRRMCPHTNIYNHLVKLKRSCLRAAERKA
ncbi:Tubulin-tyrosine ligase family [Phytophthora infestans]|uniref:Tubulin-tyrosine ligase family n=1 Tax=Phytophthora infestans TaxID=4787 RepID=A0A8S9TQY3_PHYIN|nr:Tubulin-tyrosine ligase family [Phytophthora infestans]